MAATLGALKGLQAADEAIRALALRAAAEIEQAVDRAEELLALRRDLGGDEGAYKRLKALEAMCDVTKVVGWLGPQLQGYLKELGGTPMSRAAMRLDRPVGGRLAQLRGSAASAGQDDS